MPKRPNPFSGDFCPFQLKTFVTQRQVNMGVNKEANMKVVYDRTLQLLRDGQRSMAAQGQEVEMMEDNPVQNNNNPTTITASPSPPSCHNDQYRLSMSGQLVYSNSPLKSVNKKQDYSKVLCVVCQNPGMPVHFVCAYCEKNLCYGCRKICVNCESGFCTSCSTVNYDERCDRVFCLNCSY
ncbi:apoptosis regulatory protein Siva-like [Lytechinus pictus]|uniref:apoptosis regulatory protein Siva-like n=1 Tax=Lytechinus pictus TaxID=7653 RepID=UPI00240DCD6E|nr:apoptosis regulatory protein Siva-like [Lytechinus pictus]